MGLGPTHEDLLLSNGYLKIKSEAQAYQLIRKFIKLNMPGVNKYTLCIIDSIKVGNWYKVCDKASRQFKLSFYNESDALSHISIILSHMASATYGKHWLSQPNDKLGGKKPYSIYKTEEGIVKILEMIYDAPIK